MQYKYTRTENLFVYFNPDIFKALKEVKKNLETRFFNPEKILIGLLVRNLYLNNKASNDTES